MLCCVRIHDHMNNCCEHNANRGQNTNTACIFEDIFKKCFFFFFFLTTIEIKKKSNNIEFSI